MDLAWFILFACLHWLVAKSVLFFNIHDGEVVACNLCKNFINYFAPSRTTRRFEDLFLLLNFKKTLKKTTAVVEGKFNYKQMALFSFQGLEVNSEFNT